MGNAVANTEPAPNPHFSGCCKKFPGYKGAENHPGVVHSCAVAHSPDSSRADLVVASFR